MTKCIESTLCTGSTYVDAEIHGSFRPLRNLEFGTVYRSQVDLSCMYAH